MASSSFVFPPQDLMRIGTYYYPEAWPAHQWPRDMENIRKLGLEFVHMGEFSWAFLEPNEGEFDFGWLEKNVALAHEQSLGVVLCTPTPTPPVWLTERYPEVLMVDVNGRRQVHGTRQHACWSVPKYRELAGRIITELGKRFGGDSRVIGWQLDNELTHYGKEPCFCEACQSKFRVWLQHKYHDIATLNRDWGTSFWSQRYQRFDQIRIPNGPENVAQINPHQKLDAQRWFAAEAADYLRFQTGLLRAHCGHRQWITTNYIYNYSAIDPTLNARDFDLVTWTIYPVHGALNEGALGFRLGSASSLAFSADFMRSLNGQHGIMELQPGQVNWGVVNPQPLPGAVRLWLLRTFASGANLVCTYRYRQPLSGAELYHSGLVGPDGVTPSFGGEQYAQVCREIAWLRRHATPGAPPPADYAARRAAILYNNEARWDIDNHKQNARWDTYGHLIKYHRALKRVGAPVDVVTEAHDFSRYAVLIAPAYQLVDAALVTRWKEFAEAGGHLILSCRSGHKDRRGHLWEAAWADPVTELIGARILFYDTLPVSVDGTIDAGEGTHRWGTWGDVLAPSEGTHVLARYADQYYAGAVAATTRRLGRGSVTYIGADSENGTLEAQLVRETYASAGLNPAVLPDGFLVDWRDGFWIAANFTAEPQDAPAPEGAELLVGEQTLPPAGVAIWKS